MVEGVFHNNISHLFLGVSSVRSLDVLAINPDVDQVSESRVLHLILLFWRRAQLVKLSTTHLRIDILLN